MDSLPYYAYTLTSDCVPIMLKAFETGTTFNISHKAWEYTAKTNGIITCKCIKNEKDYKIQVTNDERRRLIKLLVKVLN